MKSILSLFTTQTEMDYIEGLVSKEGGYIRTGSRTPMQWNDEKNHGFSTSDNPYLPTDSRPGAPTVEKELEDSSSVINFVKELIRLHKTIPALKNILISRNIVKKR